ncbi:MAG TPA: DUF5666 domain-containing protein [Ktedonobacteraceae bacterium]|nr:DUF5666 domain-containing protein [Ktedonobacteraceae bacterium]
MIQRMKSGLIICIIGSALLLAILGGGGFALAQAHAGTGSVNNSVGQQSNTSALLVKQDDEDLHIEGVIQSIDNAALTFALLPSGKMQTITIAFDRKTRIEQEHEQLDSGSQVLVEVVRRSGDILYATEIKPVKRVHQGPNPGDDNGVNDGNDDHGNGDGSHHHGGGGKSGPGDND